MTPVRVRHRSTGRRGTIVGTAEQGRYAVVAWDGYLTLAEPWAALAIAE